MKRIIIAVLLLAGCSSEEDRKQQAGPGSAASGGTAAPAAQPGDAAQLAGLTGLYEGGEGDRRHQMCVVKGKGGEQRFGLVVWGDSMHSCSGSGTVSREGDRLRLAMAGDSACTIEASISGTTVKLPGTVPEGCSYYCGARASLGGAELKQAGTTEQAAMRAKDIVGDPLCGGEAG